MNPKTLTEAIEQLEVVGKKAIGCFDVTIRIRLNQDITVEEARKFVQEMDYNIGDNGIVSISYTEVVSDDLPDISETTDFGVKEYIEIDECVAAGMHLENCDDDGYCNACGYPDSVEEATKIIEARDHKRGLYGMNGMDVKS